MDSIAFYTGHNPVISSVAVQHKPVSRLSTATNRSDDCGATDCAETYLARGILYGLVISAPLWGVIVGAVFLVCRTIG